MGAARLPQSGSVKRNLQLPEGAAAAEKLGSMVTASTR
jgi:hypothetical protein